MRYTVYFLYVLVFSSVAYPKQIELQDIDYNNIPTFREYIRKHNIPLDFPVSEMLSIENDKIRWCVYAEIGGAIRNEGELSKKVALTDLFVRGLKDEKVDYYVANRLRLPPFEKEYFSDEAKQAILEPEIGEIRYPFYIRILAVAEIDDPRVDLATLSKQEKAFKSDDVNRIFEATQTEHFVFYASPAWAATVVEARRGNEEALNRVLSDVRGTEKLRMAGRPEVVEDLGFIRQPEAVDVLVDFLFSDVPSAEPVFHGDTGVVPLSCRAAKALSMCLVDYPLDYWGIYGPEQVEEAREFIRNYKGPWRIIGKPVPEEEVPVEAAPEVEAAAPEETVQVDEILVESPESQPAPTPVTPEPEPAPWWPWALGGGVILLIVLFVASRSRSKA